MNWDIPDHGCDIGIHIATTGRPGRSAACSSHLPRRRAMAECGEKRSDWIGREFSCNQETGHRRMHSGSDPNTCDSLVWAHDRPCPEPGEQFYRIGYCACGWLMKDHPATPLPTEPTP